MKRIINPPRIATAVVAVALLAACGSEPTSEATDRSGLDGGSAAAWSVQQWAEQHERSAHLEGLARTYGTSAERRKSAERDSVEAAETIEREAKLAGQARTYGADQSTDQPAPVDETSDGEFVPGSRHMPTR
jgi:hypothetical protein